MKKKLVTLCAALALCATAIVGGTLAYFTDNKTATNTFTVGNVEITLTEPKWTEAGEAGHTNVYPGQKLDKDPTVTNSGNNACYVRIKVEGLNQFGDKGDITYLTNGENKLGAGWVEKDGYFYYTEALKKKGESTSALFDQIQVPTGLTNEDGGVGKNVEVKAEAVQAQGLKDNPTVAEIAAWFATCGL